MPLAPVKIAPDLQARVRAYSQKQHRSPAEIVRAALDQYLPAEGLSAADLAGDLCGCLEGPEDLSTNPKYLEGFGK